MTNRNHNSQRGFSLLELMIVMAVFLVIMAAVLIQSRTATQRSANERVQLDLFQESREFMDQMSRDMRQVGYPNPRNFDHNTLLNTARNTTTLYPATTSALAAVGLIYAGPGDLWFQGGTDESGNVFVTQYHLDTSTTGGCPCLKRSQRTRNGYNAATGVVNEDVETTGLPYPISTPTWWTEVQNVQNAADPNNPIFRFYWNNPDTHIQEEIPATTLGATWPVSWDTDGTTANNQVLSYINTVKITLVVQSPTPDLQTGVKPIITLVSTVRVNNCSQGALGQLSCTN